MPRTKDSDDENEVKAGRRSRAVTGTNVIDSPLRRSTRNRQHINQDVSPDTANNTTGPPTRTARRKAATHEAISTETTRSLRSRKTSITSDTSESHDSETYDIKRTTRRSTTAAAASETPTSVRIRRSIRAGSESKTIQSPTKTSRKTRASSLDLEERDNKLPSNLQAAHNSTPVKLRKRASILPSEPVLIEETEKDDKDLEESLRLLTQDTSKEDDNTPSEFSVKIIDSAQSPVLRLNLSRSVSPEAQNNIEKLDENPDNLPVNASKPSNEFILNSILEEPNDLEPKKDSEIFNESDYNVNEIINSNTPKVIIEKIKYPFSKESSEKSPGNKENEKSNATVQIKKKLKFPSPHEIPTQRKSLISMASKKVSITERLNKSTDDRILTLADHVSKKFSPVSMKSLENFPDIESVGENIYSVCCGPKNESVIIVEEIKKPDDCIETSNGNSDVKEDPSLMDTSNNCINDKIDVLDEAPSEVNTIEPTSVQNNEVSLMIIDEEETNTTKDDSKIIDHQPDVTSTLTSPPKTNEENEISSSIIQETESVVDEPEKDKDMEFEKEKTLDNTKNESLLNECSVEQSDERTEQSQHSSFLKKAHDGLEEINKTIENEPSCDLKNLFKDIPADEWNNEETSQSIEKNNPEEKTASDNMKEVDNKNIENEKEKKTDKESIEDFELVLVDKKAWEAAEQERMKMIETNNDSDSTDTILMQLMECKKSIDPPASPLFEEPMDTGGDETETEAEQTDKDNINKSRSSLSKRLVTYEEFFNQNNEDNEEEHEEEEEASNLNKSNASAKKIPVKRLTPIKINSPTQMKKDASPAKSSTDSPLIRKKKSLNLSLADKNSFESSLLNTSSDHKFPNTALCLDTALESEDDKTDENNELKCISKSSKNFTRNSLNKSKNQENNFAMDTDEDEIEQQEEKKSPLKSAKKMNKPLNKSPSKKSQNNSLNVSDADVENVHQVSLTSRQLKDQNLNNSQLKLKNYSIVVQVNSDSEAESPNSESSNDSGPILPAFLFGDSSSSNEAEDSDSSSIDSDIAREYNLNGSSISEYSDDDVPGDICRTSETESSAEEDDDADDMADFIVDDDEIDEEMEDEETEDEESEINSDESKNEDDEDMEVAKKDTDIELQGSESDNISRIRGVKKHLEFNSTAEHNKDQSLDKSKSKITNSESKVLRKNKLRQSWNELCNDSITSKTPSNGVRELADTKNEEKKEMSFEKKSKKSDVSGLNKSELNKLDTPKSVKSTKKNKSLIKPEINIENSFHVEDIVPTSSKLSKTSSFNQSMLTPFTVSPETKFLLKEKLNDTLPAMKLEQREKNRRSSLFTVDENINNKDDELIETKIIKKLVDEFNEDKKKKKKKRKIATNGVDIEDVSSELNENSPILSKHIKKNLEKKKKKKIEERNNSFDSEVSNVSLKNKMKKNKKSLNKEMEENPLKKIKNKKQSVTVEKGDQVFAEIKNKKITKTETKNNVPNKKTTCSSAKTYFEAFNNEFLNEVIKGSKKPNKSKAELSHKANSETGKSSTNIIPTSLAQSRVKRLSEDVLESLSDVPVQPKKRRKLSVDQKVLPSKKMFNSKNPKPANLSIQDEEYIPLSSSGSTTSFYVMNLEKPKKSKKLAAVYSFRERMLRRNPRQPVSAYLMYQQKLKASNHDKY